MSEIKKTDARWKRISGFVKKGCNREDRIVTDLLAANGQWMNQSTVVDAIELKISRPDERRLFPLSPLASQRLPLLTKRLSDSSIVPQLCRGYMSASHIVTLLLESNWLTRKLLLSCDCFFIAFGECTHTFLFLYCLLTTIQHADVMNPYF